MAQKVSFLWAILLFCLTLHPGQVLAEPGVSAQASFVMEKNSGRVLYQKNADTRLPIASTTKIMTAIVALEQGDPDTQIQISASAAGVEGSSMYLETGETMTLRELLYGLMLSSGNDAAVAIAEHFGGIETFVSMMNQKAQELGAGDTHFANPNGLPDDAHYSTARDMAVITAYGLQNPAFSEIVSSKTYTVSGEGKAYPRTLTNHNRLLRMYEGCIGVKTGFTKAAGRCLVSAAERDGMTLICVTLNAPDDWNDHMNLYDDLFQRYRLCPILRCGTPLDTIAVENSETSSLPVTAAADFSYPLTESEQCTVSLTLSPPLSAPVADAAQCGTVTVTLGENTLTTLPAITAGSAQRITIFNDQDNLLHKITNFLGKWLPHLKG